MGKTKNTLPRGADRPAQFRSAAQEATISILRTADVVRRRLSSVVEPHGITLQQYNVLRILRGAGGNPLATVEIGERLIEQTPGVTRLLDRLESKGLVSRERSAEDRRLVYTWITDSGLRLLEKLDEPVDRADDEAVGSLTRKQIQQLTTILEQVKSG